MHRGASSATPVLELIFIFVIGLNDELEPVHALAYCIYYAVIKLKQWITCLTNFFFFLQVSFASDLPRVGDSGSLCPLPRHFQHGGPQAHQGRKLFKGG